MWEKHSSTTERFSAGSATSLSRPAHTISAHEVAQELGVDALNGLTSTEASSRLAQHGRNKNARTRNIQPLRIVIAQLANGMTLVLIMAMAVSYAIKSWVEAGIVTAMIVLNVVVEFVQEYRAERTMDSLRSLSSHTASVIRDGDIKVVPATEVVVGDLVEINAGDTIPADIRLLEAVNLETDESLLTGEPHAVRKNEDEVLNHDASSRDHVNIIFGSTTVIKGRAKGIVFATGTRTELAAIAHHPSSGQTSKKPRDAGSSGRSLETYTLTFTDTIGGFLGVNVGTPLQKQLSRLAVILFFLSIICAVIVLAANRFDSSQETVIYAVTTGLAMVPASLVVVLAITMVAGTKRLVQRNVIIRNLKSLETLGAVTAICTDKSGTLTQGRMLARGVWVPGMGTYTIENSSSPFKPSAGEIRFDSRQPRHINFRRYSIGGVIVEAARLLNDSKNSLDAFLRCATLGTLATVTKTSDADEDWHVRGEPADIATQIFALRFGWDRLSLTSGDQPQWKEVTESPFDAEAKLMSVVMEEVESGKQFVFTKGAAEKVLSICTMSRPRDIGDEVPLTDAFRNEILRNMESFAGMGLQVVALASKPLGHRLRKGDEVNRSTIESNLVFRGLIGLYDPPRAETKDAVRACQEAGIAVHMLTGDHPGTARTIAVDVGILPPRLERVSRPIAENIVMTAATFDAMTDEEIDKLPALPLVIARCAPRTKIRMIEALRRRGKLSAITGDGVNDGPALRRADVGIAMGLSGSDVAKDASDVVLADDNFASIVSAIEEGRRIFDNIQKFVLHILAINTAMTVTLLAGLAFKDNEHLSVFPLSPVEIVWLVMFTCGLADIGLGLEHAVPDIMRRMPRPLATGIFATEFFLDMVVYGVWAGAICLSAFSLVVYLWGGGSLGDTCNESTADICDTAFRARSTAFACITWFVLLLGWETMEVRQSLFQAKPDAGWYLTQWAMNIWRNQFLFWSILSSFVVLFVLVYVPVLNTVVFRHKSITWEWSVVVVAAVVFVMGIEAWKFGKRTFFKRRAKKNRSWKREEIDVEERAFADYFQAVNWGPNSDADTVEKRRSSVR